MELTKQKMEQIVKANNKVAECYKELAKARTELWDIERGLTDYEWRNTKMSYWKDICKKYPEDKLLNCYGDIFFIDEHEDDWYIGRRVLWNLELSKEKYEIRETIEYDSDGEYDHIDYEIRE